jgi:hypothetical protein
MTTETLITEGQNTQVADQQQAADVQTNVQTDASAQAEDQQAGGKGSPEGRPADGEKAEDDKAKPEGAPEKYEFVAPEGREFDPEVLGAFSEVAKEINLSNESAQKVLDKIAPVLAAKQEKAIEDGKAAWTASSKADKEFGGDKLQENLAVAKKARDAFGTPELTSLLDESGLGNHPEVIRFFFRAGKAISEDNFVGNGHGSTQPATAQKLYSASNMNP